MGSWISILELVAVFSLVIGFCLWQLRDLNKLDREEAENKARDE